MKCLLKSDISVNSADILGQTALMAVVALAVTLHLRQELQCGPASDPKLLTAANTHHVIQVLNLNIDAKACTACSLLNL